MRFPPLPEPALHGMRIVPHPLAVDSRMEVQRHPIKKRRRNWRVVRVERPGCWQMGNTFFMHPELVAKLRALPLPQEGESE